MTAVKVNFEIGHKASIRAKKTPEGFTHDWEVFVRGQEGADISHFVEKVVFHLHATFPKPKRVVKEPPFSIKESGYAGFNLPIEIYLKSREEPKKIKFYYDLSLQEKGPTTYNLLKDRYIFQNPNEEFKKKLLKGGGIIVYNNAFYTNPDQDNKNRYSYNEDKPQLIGKPKLSSDSKKHKSKEIKEETPHRTNSFENLFGLPIQKPPKVSPDPKKIEKPVTAVKIEKKEKDCSNSEKQKPKHEHKEIKTEKSKNKDNKVKTDKQSKSHGKELDKPKDKPPKRSNERPPSPDPPKKHCPSAPQRLTSPPPRSNSELTIKDEYKTSKPNVDNSDQKKPKVEEKIPEIKMEKEVKEKKKKEKKSHDRDKEKKEKKDHKKDNHKPNKDSPKDPSKDMSRLKELPKDKNTIKETPPSTPIKEKSSKIDKPFNKFSIENHIKTPIDTGERLEDCKIKDKTDQERKHKHKKKEKKRDESREKNKEPGKEKKHKHDKIREAPTDKIENVEHRDMTLPKERPPEPVSPISIDTASQCSSKSEIAKVSLVGGDIGNSSHSDSEASVIAEEEQEKIKIENHSPEPPKEQVPTPEPEPEPEPVVEPPVAPHKDKSKKHKDKSAKREEKRRKRKAAEEEQESRKSVKLNESSTIKLENEHGEGSGITTETKLQDNGVSSSLGEDGEPGQMSPDYMVQLRELQQRIMTIKSNEELERVVNLIAETGRYEVTTQTFDFDLCSLDRSTVQQLLQLVGC